jgi:hypothetical protein
MNDDDEVKTPNKFIMLEKNEKVEKIQQSELHNLNNKFSVGYEANSNMKTKVGTILLP